VIGFRRTLAAATLAAALIGCAGGKPLAPVTGTVNFQKAPLKEGEITFFPEGGRPSYGKIVDGKITEVRSDEGPGVPPGMSKVAISSVEGAGDMYAKTKSRIPEKYADPAKSNLTAEVKAGANDLTFDLTK